MSTKSALRADLDAEDWKTLAEDRKRMVCGTRAVMLGHDRPHMLSSGRRA